MLSKRASASRFLKTPAGPSPRQLLSSTYQISMPIEFSEIGAFFSKLSHALLDGAYTSQTYRQSLAGQNPILFTPDAADAAEPW